MNIFFGIKSKEFDSYLNIPTFKNDNTKINKDYSLYVLRIINSKWEYEKIKNKEDSNFYFLNSDFSNNQNIFVISSDKEMTNIKNKNEIIDLNNFTNTSPAYRANLKIKIDGGGFSSYQSEYPFHMTTKNGNVLSPLSTLLNIDADKNFLVFKNIYYKAINEKFNIYIINVKSKKILKKYIGICNQTNIFEINKDVIHYENFIFSENFLGIPIYVSIKNNHISMEHTHPPHEYILSKDKFYRVSLLKKKINEIIN